MISFNKQVHVVYNFENEVIEHSILFISCLALQQNIASNQFQDDLEVERDASRWLMTPDTEHYQHGVGKLTCLGGETTWKSTGLAVQLNLNGFYSRCR
jgi:hypothetical protein